MSDGPLSFQRSWEGFLPPNTVIMAKRALSPATGAGVRFGFEASELGNPAARDLLDKIIAALEIPASDFAIFTEAPAGAAAMVIRFAAAEGEPVGEWNGGVLTTYSLRAMLGNPGLKKPVWAHLKDAVARGRG